MYKNKQNLIIGLLLVILVIVLAVQYQTFRTEKRNRQKTVAAAYLINNSTNSQEQKAVIKNLASQIASKEIRANVSEAKLVWVSDACIALQLAAQNAAIAITFAVEDGDDDAAEAAMDSMWDASIAYLEAGCQ